MITKELRSQIFAQSRPVQQWLYSDGENGDLLYYIAHSYNLNEDNLYRKFAVTVGDIILGFYDVSDTEPLLIQELGISAEVAKPLAADVQEFLAPLSDPNWQPPVEEGGSEETFYSGLIPEETEKAAPVTESNEDAIAHDTPQVTRPTVPPPVSESTQPATDIPITEPSADVWGSTTDTPGIRTMAQDMEGARSPQRNAFEPLDDDTPTHVSNQSQ